MFYPCTECYRKFDKQYTSECDDKCDYARAVKENKLIRERVMELYSYEKLQELNKWVIEHFSETILNEQTL